MTISNNIPNQIIHTKRIIPMLVFICSSVFSVYGQMEPVLELTLNEDPEKHFAFHTVLISPDGKYIATGSYNLTTIWDSQTGENVIEYDQIRDTASIAFSPDGKSVLSGGSIYSAHLWDIQNGETILKFRSSTPEYIRYTYSGMTNVAFSSDGTKIITSDGNGVIQVWDATTGEEYRSGLPRLSSSPKNKIISLTQANEILIDMEDELQIWDYESMQKVMTIPNARDPIVSPDRRSIVFRALHEPTGTIRVMNLDTKNIVWEHAFDRSEIVLPQTFAVSNHNEFVVFGAARASSDTVGPVRPREIYSLHSNTFPVRSYPYNVNSKNGPDSVDQIVQFFPDGKRFLTMNWNKIYVWDISGLMAHVKEAEKY